MNELIDSISLKKDSYNEFVFLNLIKGYSFAFINGVNQLNLQLATKNTHIPINIHWTYGYLNLCLVPTMENIDFSVPFDIWINDFNKEHWKYLLENEEKFNRANFLKNEGFGWAISIYVFLMNDIFDPDEVNCITLCIAREIVDTLHVNLGLKKEYILKHLSIGVTTDQHMMKDLIKGEIPKISIFLKK